MIGLLDSTSAVYSRGIIGRPFYMGIRAFTADQALNPRLLQEAEENDYNPTINACGLSLEHV